MGALLQQWVKGDQAALGEVVPVVYAELRRLAHHHMKSERADHTLQSTARVWLAREMQRTAAP
jgi:hypothetical protein